MYPSLPDETLAAAAWLIRRFHDATAGTRISHGHETVCHGDLSPCNFIFRDGGPIGMIDFDAAVPGTRLQDVGYALFLWLNLGTDGPSPTEQARRIQVFCHGYGIEGDEHVIEASIIAVAANLERLCAARRHSDVKWWQEQLDWLSNAREELVRSLQSQGHSATLAQARHLVPTPAVQAARSASIVAVLTRPATARARSLSDVMKASAWSCVSATNSASNVVSHPR